MNKYKKAIAILKKNPKTNPIYKDIFFTDTKNIIKDYQVEILMDMMFDFKKNGVYFNSLTNKFRIDFANTIIGFPQAEPNPEVDIIMECGLYKSLGIISDNFGFANEYTQELQDVSKSISNHKQMNKFYKNKLDDFLLNTVGIVLFEKVEAYGVKLLSANERKHLIDERYKNMNRLDFAHRYRLNGYHKTYC